MRSGKETAEAKPNWTEESFYFGSAGWPSDATYRSDGERLQIQVEMSVPLTPVESKIYKADPNETGQFNERDTVAGFLAKYQDCEIHVYDSYIATSSDGQHVPPALFLIGWDEITTLEGRQQYEQDKNDGVRT